MSFTGCHRCFKSRCHISFQNNKAAADVPETFQQLFLYSPAEACTIFQSCIRESEAARVYAPPRIPPHQQVCRSVRALQKPAPREPAPPCMPPRRRRGLRRCYSKILLDIKLLRVLFCTHGGENICHRTRNEST